MKALQNTVEEQRNIRVHERNSSDRTIADLKEKLETIEIQHKHTTDTLDEEIHALRILNKKVSIEKTNVEAVLKKTSATLFEARGDIERLQVDIKAKEVRLEMQKLTSGKDTITTQERVDSRKGSHTGIAFGSRAGAPQQPTAPAVPKPPVRRTGTGTPHTINHQSMFFAVAPPPFLFSHVEF